MKWIAAVLMLVDHIGSYFKPNMSVQLNVFLRTVGRLAFPIFAYYVGVGCSRTRSKFKYFMRMLTFAVLSEILMEYTDAQTANNRSNMNVMLTFVLAMLFIFAWEVFVENWHRLDDGQLQASIAGKNRKLDKKILWNRVVLVGSVVFMFTMLLTSHFLKTDYGIYGILSVFLFYYVHKNIRKNALALRQDMQAFFAFLIGFVLINFIWHIFKLQVPMQSFSVFSIFLLLLESKSKKSPGIISKYFFYFFYPLHCCLLMLISFWINV